MPVCMADPIYVKDSPSQMCDVVGSPCAVASASSAVLECFRGAHEQQQQREGHKYLTACDCLCKA